MKFMHLSDLHIGKRVNEFSMIEDQDYILRQIVALCDQETPDGVLIAGDVYDKTLPTVEGVTLLDDFLYELHKRKLPVFLISGNHDSAERLHFGSRIFQNNEIYLSGTFRETMPKITMEDAFGPVNIYLLPFIKPAIVSAFYEGVESYEEAVRVVLDAAKINTKERNVLLMHQFITAGGVSPERCESENISLGGVDNVDASLLMAFDYVALGHLHGPQQIGRPTIRYAGSPLKYSFSEARQKKSVTMVTLEEKGKVSFELLPLHPLRDMRELKGPIEEILKPANYSKGNTKDYVHVTLTDEEEIYDAIGALRAVYPNIMRLDYDNARTRWNGASQTVAGEVLHKSPIELFGEFYENQNNVSLTKEQTEILKETIGKFGGDV